MYQDVFAPAVGESKRARRRCRASRVGSGDIAGDIGFDDLVAEPAPQATPRANADAWSIMLYTSGTTSRPKGVPRRHRAERAAGDRPCRAESVPARRAHARRDAALSHHGRALAARDVADRRHVRLPAALSTPAAALALIEGERITNLYLVPTLYHDLVHAPEFAAADVSSVRKLGFAGASMTDGLLKTLNDAFQPDLFVNHYGSSEIYTFTIDQNAAAKPGSAGRAGINQQIRVVRLNAGSAAEVAASQ